jgi:hypothetical protein
MDSYPYHHQTPYSPYDPTTESIKYSNGGYETVHIGFLKNEQMGTGTNVFTIPDTEQNKMGKGRRGRIRRGIISGDIETGEQYYQQALNNSVFHRLRTNIRNYLAGKVMNNMRYRHCELAFDQKMFRKYGVSYSGHCWVSYSTNLVEKKISRKPRTFAIKKDPVSLKKSGILDPEKAYEWIHLRLPTKDVDTLIKSCESELNKEYDESALERMPFFPKRMKPIKDWHKQQWHCTNFTAFQLQQVGLLRGLDPNVLSADSIYDYLDGHSTQYQIYITPSKQKKEIEETIL